MPRPPTDAWYRDRVYRMAAEGTKTAAIVREVEQQAAAAGREDFPSERTIRRIIADYKKLPAGQQAEFGPVVWPDTFEAGLLPWESAKDVLELLAHYHRTGLGWLSVDVARWWYRLRQALPSLAIWHSYLPLMLAHIHLWPTDIQQRYREAGLDAPADRREGSHLTLTGFLAFDPLSSDDAYQQWERWRSDSGEENPFEYYADYLRRRVVPDLQALNERMRAEVADKDSEIERLTKEVERLQHNA